MSEIAGSLSVNKAYWHVAEYDSLRVIVTLLVMIGHSTYYCIMTQYGSCDYTGLTYPGLSGFYRLTEFIVLIIYLFHMQLYMALSGALYRMKMTRGGYYSYSALIMDKVHKILVPFVVVTLLYSTPIKYLSGYYRASDHILSDVIVGQVLIQGNTYLWFLLTLFTIFVIAYLLEKIVSYIKIRRIYIFAVLFGVSFVSIKMPITIVRQVMYYLFWFYAGGCFETIRDAFNRKAKLFTRIFILSLMVLLVAPYVSGRIPRYPGIDIFAIMDRMITYISALAGCVCTYIVCFKMSKTRVIGGDLFKIIRNHTFGLYLYSEPLNYLLLSIFTSIWGSFVFVTDLGAALIIVGRICISFIVAIVISSILKRTKLNYLS